jgi:hypothetical protein
VCRFCIGTADNCLPPHAFLDPISSAKELFTGPHRREGVQDHELLEIFGATGHNDCEPQRPGFNTQCADGNSARWGFCNNIPSQGCQIHDADDADAVIGIGLEGQDCCPMGAGWTNYFVNSNANGGSEQRLQAFIKVRAAPDCVPPGWTVVLKTDGDDTFQYSSPHWADSTSVLNPTTHPSQPGNAKYPEYNTVMVSAVSLSLSLSLCVCVCVCVCGVTSYQVVLYSTMCRLNSQTSAAAMLAVVLACDAFAARFRFCFRCGYGYGCGWDSLTQSWAALARSQTVWTLTPSRIRSKTPLRSSVASTVGRAFLRTSTSSKRSALPVRKPVWSPRFSTLRDKNGWVRAKTA